MLALLLCSPAVAHIEMDKPNPVTTLQKIGPCGDGPHVRGADFAEFEPGQSITVKWHETVHHDSTYRISFDDDGDDSFADPATPDDVYTNDTVLLDEIEDEPGQADYAVEVTLPDIECETCTLQLIQLMLDKPPYVPGTNDIYYQCADLTLRAVAPAGDTGPAVDDGDESDTSSAACGCNSGSSPALGLVAALFAVILRRRRSRCSEGPEWWAVQDSNL